MTATKEDVEKWLEKGKKMGATHVIVVCDTWDYEDYPVFVMPGEDVQKRYEEYNGKNMQIVMEVYSLKQNIEEQLNEHRALRFD